MRTATSRHRVAWWIALAGLLVLLVVFCLVPGREPPLQPLMALRRPFAPSVRVRDRIESWIPRTGSWQWARKVTDTVFGVRRPVTIDVEAFAFQGAFATRQIEIELGKPSFALPSEGLAVWFMTYPELNTLRARFEAEQLGSAYRSKVSTADGFGASLSMASVAMLKGATNQIGVQQDYFPRVGPKAIDLFTSLLISQLVTNSAEQFELDQAPVFIRTNADVAVRMQIPNHRGVFLLKRDLLDHPASSAGLILEPR